MEIFKSFLTNLGATNFNSIWLQDVRMGSTIYDKNQVMICKKRPTLICMLQDKCKEDSCKVTNEWVQYFKQGQENNAVLKWISNYVLHYLMLNAQNIVSGSFFTLQESSCNLLIIDLLCIMFVSNILSHNLV